MERRGAIWMLQGSKNNVEYNNVKRSNLKISIARIGVRIIYPQLGIVEITLQGKNCD
jgi:hypothetical protein